MIPLATLVARLEVALEDARLVALHGSTPEQREAAVVKCQEQLKRIREAL